MIVENQKLLDCIELFAPHFSPFRLEHLVSFATLNLKWSANKVLTTIYVLDADNKISIENNIIQTN